MIRYSIDSLSPNLEIATTTKKEDDGDNVLLEVWHGRENSRSSSTQ
jgi:hypothetical protein